MTADQLAQLAELRELVRVYVPAERMLRVIDLTRNLLPALMQERDEMLKEIRSEHNVGGDYCKCKFCGGEK